MERDASPTARALLVLELIQNRPGIRAERLADRLGVSERAVRRHVGILRDVGVPIESVRGPYGGYRVGRGLRVPPLMFTTHEALGLVMAVLEAHRGGTDPTDPVETALDKIIRVLPEPVAGPAEAVRGVSARGPLSGPTSPSPETTALLVQSCAARHRLRLGYRLGPDKERSMEVDPWAVVVRLGRWYLLCWSHTKSAERVLRLDRVTAVEVLAEEFTPPEDLDPVEALEQHLAEGWKYDIEVLVDAAVERVARWIPPKLGRLEPVGEEQTRLVASTDEPDWYAEQLAAIHAPFCVVTPPELVEACDALGRRFLQASAQPRGKGSGR